RPLVGSLADIYRFDPLPDDLTAEQRGHVLGVQANLWAEYLPTFARVQHQAFPRVAALAAVAWSPAAAIGWDSFVARMPAQLARYGALGVAYADSAWAPHVELAADGDRIRVTLGNQVAQGRIRYTVDGSEPDADAPPYRAPFDVPANRTTTVKAAAFTA